MSDSDRTETIYSQPPDEILALDPIPKKLWLPIVDAIWCTWLLYKEEFDRHATAIVPRSIMLERLTDTLQETFGKFFDQDQRIITEDRVGEIYNQIITRPSYNTWYKARACAWKTGFNGPDAGWKADAHLMGFPFATPEYLATLGLSLVTDYKDLYYHVRLLPPGSVEWIGAPERERLRRFGYEDDPVYLDRDFWMFVGPIIPLEGTSNGASQ